MGADIVIFAERREGGHWVRVLGREQFDSRSYAIFGWLAGVRNYSAVGPLTPPRGLPSDLSPEVADAAAQFRDEAHGHGWLSVAELQAVNYEQAVEDRRGKNGTTLPAGEGRRVTLREFLGPCFFEYLNALKSAGAQRVVFWFFD